MWVARNKNGKLILFGHKPVRHPYKTWNWFLIWKIKVRPCEPFIWVDANYMDEDYFVKPGNKQVFYGVWIDDETFPCDLTWEDEPIEVKLTKVE